MSAFSLEDRDAGDAPREPDEKTAAIPKQRRSSRSTRERQARRPAASLEQRITESLEAVAGWLRDRGDDELGRVLDRDAAKMAAVLGRIAGVNPVAKRAVGVVADALEPVRAFAPTLRIVWRRFLERRELSQSEREADQAGEPEAVTQPATVAAPPDENTATPVAEPWKIR